MGDNFAKENRKEDLPDDTLEIEVVEKSPAGKALLRKKFRYRVKGYEDCWVLIEKKKYPLYDVSKYGLGISGQPDVVFRIGQCFGDILKDCTLNILEHNISGLNYKMIHISPHKGDRMICGLNWVNPVPGKRDEMESAIQSLNDKIFNETE